MQRTLILILTLTLLASCSKPPSINCTEGNSSGSFALRTKWCLRLDWPINHPPKVEGNVVYLHVYNPSSATFYAVDTEIANVLWTYNTAITQGLEPYDWGVVKERMIIAGGPTMEALELSTGKTVWRRVVYSTVALTTDGEKIYLASSGYAQAIDPSSGNTLWEYSGLPSHFTFDVLYDPVNSTVVIPADRIYVLAARSGQPVHVNDIQFSAGVYDARAYKGQLVYGNKIVDPSSGEVTYRIADGVDTSQPLLINSDTLYYLTTSGGLASLNLNTKSQNWVYYPIGKDSTVHSFLTNVAVVNDYGYILTDDDTLRAISLATGKEVGRWSGPSSSYSLAPRDQLIYIPPASLISSDGVLYLSLGTNLLYAFESR